MLNELRDLAYEIAKQRGFYNSPNVLEKLMHVVMEVAEAAEAYSKARFYLPTGKGDELYERSVRGTFEDELADSVISLLSLCGYMKVDIDKHMAIKMKYNSTRASHKEEQ